MTITARASAPATGQLLSLDDALATILAGVEPLPLEHVALDDALGRFVAEPVTSRLTLPPWDNSAMDGYAVMSAELLGTTAERPRRLRVVGEAAAGRATRARVEPGTAVRILTGAPLPAGADAVIPVEETRPVPDGGADGEGVDILAPSAHGAHVRRAGSDLGAGTPLLARGDALGPAQLALAAAGGHGHLPVHRRPRVAVLATGDELVAPGEALGDAQIPDSNSIGLLAQARDAGADAGGLGIVGDRLDEIVERLAGGLAWADIVVVSGGVSVGVHDFVKDAFARLGQVQLWRVAVQPGKPLAFARAARRGAAAADSSSVADRQVLLFGLPGNPVSSFVTFELFVRPVLRRLAGAAELSGREVVHASLVEPVTKAPGRRAFLRVRLEQDPRSRGWLARLAGGQGSHVLSALAVANGLAVVPEDVRGLPAGAVVDVIRLPQPERG